MSKKAIILVILIFIGVVLITTGVYAANEVVSSNNKSEVSTNEETKTLKRQCIQSMEIDMNLSRCCS